MALASFELENASGFLSSYLSACSCVNLCCSTRNTFLSACTKRQRKFIEAEPLYQHALSIHEQLDLEHSGAVRCLNELAGLYMLQFEFTKAKLLLQLFLAL